MNADTSYERLTMAQQLLLLALDDEKGNVAEGEHLDSALAGALLLDLMAGGSLTAEDGKLQAAGSAPSGDPLAAEAYELIAAEDGRHDAKGWVKRLPGKLKPLKERVADGLVESGVLEEERGKTLGLFARTRWPELDPEPERALRERLHEVLVDGAQPRPREALLISILEPTGLIGSVVQRSERKEATRRAKELAEDNAVAGGLSAGIDEATMAAVTASVVAATSVTVTSSN